MSEGIDVDDVLDWKNELCVNRCVDLSTSLEQISNDLWLHLVQSKCQSNFIQQIRSNQRNYVLTLNEQFQRRVISLSDQDGRENSLV